MTRRTVVFDVGGVIVRWQPDELMRHCFARHAVDEASAQAVKAQVFQSFAPDADWSAFDRGVVDAEALSDSIAARTGLPRSAIAEPLAVACSKGWLEDDTDWLRPTELGRRFTNDVIGLFLP